MMRPLVVDFHLGLKKENDVWFTGNGNLRGGHLAMLNSMDVKELKLDGMCGMYSNIRVNMAVWGSVYVFIRPRNMTGLFCDASR